MVIYAADSHTIRYDTRCYINVRSKANMSRLNLPHATDNWKSVKLKSKKRICSEVTVNSLGNPRSQSWRRKEGYGGKDSAAEPVYRSRSSQRCRSTPGPCWPLLRREHETDSWRTADTVCAPNQLRFWSAFFTAYVRYDARCYFNVRSKADMSRLNLPHATDN